jgi:signal transduction histidine kinase
VIGDAHPRLAPPSWLRLPRRTARLRLTALYGGLFLLSGVALVAITYVLFERATEYRPPHLPKVPHTSAIQNLKLPSPPAKALYQGQTAPFVQHAHQLAQAQQELGQAQTELAQARPGLVAAVSTPLARVRNQLAQAQHQLSQGQHQLADAVHQVAQAGSVQAAQRAADSHQLLVNSAIALAIVAVLAVLAGWLIAGRMLRPLRTITRTARRISSTSLHERLALDGPQDELKELGDTLDDLFGRLDAAFEAQRQFVANASHEMRAPLTRQRALIQVALADPDSNFTSLRAAHERVLASEQHLEQLIDALLALTRGQAGLERRERLDLATIAAQGLLARESEAAGLDLDVNATLATAPAAGDPRLLERLIANLIDNGIRHNRTGGQLEIATGTRDQRAFVAIANTGPTIPPDEIQRLFQPFQRLKGARTSHNNGYGLGLSIVQAIADAHDAELDARAPPEGGLTIEISFPPAAGAGAPPTFASVRTRRSGRAVSETDAPARG